MSLAVEYEQLRSLLRMAVVLPLSNRQSVVQRISSNLVGNVNPNPNTQEGGS